jgi:anti-sigma factor RsiW
MSLPDVNKLVDALRQDKLTHEQEAQLQQYLTAHPDQRAHWEEELALNQLLRQVPDAPLSSNFTAQVLQAVRQAPWRSEVEVSFWRKLFSHNWQAKYASALALVCIGLFSYHEHALSVRRDLAQNLAEMSRLTSQTPVEFLENFDAIERLNQVPVHVDRELVAALQ